MLKKKIVLIDVDDTLLDFHQCSYVSLVAAFKACQLEFKENYHHIFLDINDKLWQQIERKEITEEELFERRFQIVFKALNINADSHLAETAFRKALDASHEPMAGAQELLDYLVKKYDLYIVSNSQYQRQVNRLKWAGFLSYFKGVYTSGRMNAVKPEYDFFEACFKEMDYPDKDEVVLLGDSLTADIQGAIRYGIEVIWFHQGKADIDVIQIEELEEIKQYL